MIKRYEYYKYLKQELFEIIFIKKIHNINITLNNFFI